MYYVNNPLSDVTSMSYACTHVASSETIVGGANISGGGIAGILFGIAGGLVVLVSVF